MRRALIAMAIVAAPMLGAAQRSTEVDLATARPGRDPRQAIDEDYTRRIREYTTAPYFLSPLVDYMPAAHGVPTPRAVLGDIAGAPGKLPYSGEVHDYMRLLARSTPRVKVVSIGTSEEGREMIAVAVASEALLDRLEQNRADLAKLADPRTIAMNDELADRIARRAAPVYYITGSIHASEAGAPTALMELAYRLAVDDSPFVRNIREHVITLITPVVEVDGRDRVVDLYEYKKKHPNEIVPEAIYWGRYVRHDNNRDAMALTLKLSQNILATYLGWKAQVLHDLHESGSFLYDNTIGDGPYNAWLDPILTNEWQMIGWHNVNEMTRMGMPGVYAFGTFDTWSPGYLMFMAATHNGISRLYETFGNSGSADTRDRVLSPNETSRTWYRQNPPISRVKWSLRNNNNYEITGLLISENYIATNRLYFLRNFYDKSKRSILKARAEGPAAYVFPATEPRAGTQAELLRLLQKQGVEISRTTAPARVTLGASTTRDVPAGSFVVRMDQPYSRIADALLDYQYWSPNDPQKAPYDDTGWTFPEGFGVESLRVVDPRVLDEAMEPVTSDVRAAGGVTGSGNVFLVNHNGDNALVTLRYRLEQADVQAAEEPFEAGGLRFNRGSFIITGVSRDAVARIATELGVRVTALEASPAVRTHPVRRARVAVLHTWTATQTEGWWRQAFDQAGVPYDYIGPEDVAATADLRAKYDAIVLGPGAARSLVDGLPMWRNPEPWRKSPETPNIGTWAQTDDRRRGLQLEGLIHIRDFVANGGVFVAATDSAELLTTTGLVGNVSPQRAGTSRVAGSLLRTKVVDAASPLMYGVPDGLAVYSRDGSSFAIANDSGGRVSADGRRETIAPGGRDGGAGLRATGRGTADDPDVVQGRPPIPVEQDPNAPPATPDGRPANNTVFTPLEFRPRPVMRFEEQKTLLVSGLLDGGAEIAGEAVVVDVPSGRGHYVLFANNPIYRGETIGSYTMVYNALLNFDALGVGRKP